MKSKKILIISLLILILLTRIHIHTLHLVDQIMDIMDHGHLHTHAYLHTSWKFPYFHLNSSIPFLLTLYICCLFLFSLIIYKENIKTNRPLRPWTQPVLAPPLWQTLQTNVCSNYQTQKLSVALVYNPFSAVIVNVSSYKSHQKTRSTFLIKNKADSDVFSEPF